MQHVDHIPFSPDSAVSAVLIEESVVTVLAFSYVPFIEILAHYHKAHLVAEFNEFFCRHIVRSTDGVAAHILENCQLASDGGFVDCGSERTEVVVQADTAEFARLSVEEESLVRDDLYCPESECSPFTVLELGAVGDAYLRPVHLQGRVDRAAYINFCAGIIETWVFRRP